MLAQVASVPTTPMTISMVTVSASARSSPPNAKCWPEPTANPSAAPQPSTVIAEATVSVAVARRHPPIRVAIDAVTGARMAASSSAVISRATPAAASRSAPPKARRSRPVRTPITITANSTSSEAPSSTISGTPAVSRNAVAAIPLSSIRNPAACEIA